ncbi:osmotically inducible protein OsmC [candidate division GN15 bacterium]|nr:osmotically inducible protein OsmC [candidate division GN15 bacterium]
MGSMSVKMKWGGGLKFEGTNDWGNTIVADVAKKSGGDESGIKPTEMLLYSVAACTGVDVVRIMEKQRQKLSSLEIEVVAHQQDEYPKPFHTMEVKYLARGENLDEKKLAQAIELSEGKYCVISQTIAQPAEVKTSYEILEE